MAITVDEMSGGRVEVGVGAGWNENEHHSTASRSRQIGERADMIEEKLEILHGLWEEPDGWSFSGEHYAIDGALFRPNRARSPGRDGGRPRILVGGQGSPRAFRIAARYADEFNLSSSSPDGRDAEVRDARRGAAGRSGATRRRSRARRWSGCSSAAPRTRSRRASRRC